MIFLKDQNGVSIKEIDALNMTFCVGEKVVLKAIQYKITEIIYNLDGKDTIINMVREGIFRE